MREHKNQAIVVIYTHGWGIQQQYTREHNVKKPLRFFSTSFATRIYLVVFTHAVRCRWHKQTERAQESRNCAHTLFRSLVFSYFILCQSLLLARMNSLYNRVCWKSVHSLCYTATFCSPWNVLCVMNLLPLLVIAVYNALLLFISSWFSAEPVRREAKWTLAAFIEGEAVNIHMFPYRLTTCIRIAVNEMNSNSVYVHRYRCMSGNLCGELNESVRWVSSFDTLALYCLRKCAGHTVYKYMLLDGKDEQKITGSHAVTGRNSTKINRRRILLLAGRSQRHIHSS